MSFRIAEKEDAKLKIREDGKSPEEIGIKVPTMQNESGREFKNADIVYLDRDSLYKHLRSKGGRNDYAEDIVAHILGHPTGPRQE